MFYYDTSTKTISCVYVCVSLVDSSFLSAYIGIWLADLFC